MPDKKRVGIIGAGPAGLTAGYLLSKAGVPVVVFERDPDYVGGISRTVQYKGFGFDIGGHRFFSKSKEVEDLWTELLPHDMLERPRSSRIYYNGKFFTYPLRGQEALFKLGIFESVRCVLSYAWARLTPHFQPATNLEDWVSRKFGKRLFSIFFKTYTEKVWGMDCKKISADWAAQRIKGLSLATAILHALKPRGKKKKTGGKVIKTLIESFRYPRRGPGMMWDAAAVKIREKGGDVRLGQVVVGLKFVKGQWELTSRDSSGRETTTEFSDIISSAPLRKLVAGLVPPPPEIVREAASRLKYRDFVIVALILKDRKTFDDNWLYIHDPGVKVGRIQNFKSWSPEMVPDPALNCYGMEYFCFENDGLWSMKDEDLGKMALKELIQLGLAEEKDIVDHCVVRQHKAYPVYDDRYTEYVATIRAGLEKDYPGLHVVGRNGMHKYNNQDHAMMTAMLTVKNILSGQRHFDVWQVNQDAEYHESGSAGHQSELGLRHVPTAVPPAA